MRKILRNLGALVLALSMTALPLTANAQRNSGRNSHFSGQSGNGGNHANRPSAGNHNNGNNKPGNNGNHNNGNNKPGNNGNHNGNHKPGNNGNHNNGNHGNNWGWSQGNHNNGNHNGNNGNHNGNFKPGNNGNHNGNFKPGNNGNHNGNVGHRPNNPPMPPRPNHYPVNHGHNYHHSVPFFGSFHRPAPPRGWRPAPGYYGPSFGTILGVALGTTIDLSIRSLINAGYNVTSYGNNVVYLTNVPQMNYYWPDAAMYYNNGVLYGSTFTYPTSYYDMSRYNALYNQFYRQYGAPVQMVNQGGVISSTWYGNGNRFVTLEYNSNYGNYYTTLSFGL